MDELDGWFTIEGSGELELEVSRCGGTVRFRIGFVGCDDGECFLDSDLYLREVLALLGLTPDGLRRLGDEMEQADAAGYILLTRGW